MFSLLKYQRILLGVLFIVLGTILIATLVGGIIGVPLFFVGIWLIYRKSTFE